MAFHMSHSEFVDAVVMGHAASIKIITWFLASTTPIPYPAILAVFDSDRVALLHNACGAAVSLIGAVDGGDEEQQTKEDSERRGGA